MLFFRAELTLLWKTWKFG